MNRVLNIISVIGPVLLFFMGYSCKHNEGEYHSITDKINEESLHYDGIETSSLEHIGDLKMIEVTEEGYTFLIPERKSQIKSFACIECHTVSLDNMQNSLTVKKAHWDIKLTHANDNTMNCITCHNGDNMDELKSLTGNIIDFNMSHQLCSQCHTRQFEDWKGGAHGKRIASWAPPRASMTCVSCHDPHEPGFKTKWPARFNTQKIKERE